MVGGDGGGVPHGLTDVPFSHCFATGEETCGYFRLFPKKFRSTVANAR